MGLSFVGAKNANPLGHDAGTKLRGRVVEDDEIDVVSFEPASQLSDQAQARFESLALGDEDLAVEENANVDVALAVGAALAVASEQVGRHYPVAFLPLEEAKELLRRYFPHRNSISQGEAESPMPTILVCGRYGGGIVSTAWAVYAMDAGRSEMIVASVETPLGRLGIVEDDDHIVRLLWETTPQEPSTPLLAEAVEQVDAYFKGVRRSFELPLLPLGGSFQQRVCAALSAIPFGETRTYGELARELGTSAQPVGNACGANSIPILIPCHRVLSATGLGGFSGSGGVSTKTRLLKHENAYPLLF